MAGLALSNEAIETSFGYYFRNLDNDSKKRIIIKFAESLNAPDPENISGSEFLSRYGTWEDDRTTEEIISIMEDGRVPYGRKREQ